MAGFPSQAIESILTGMLGYRALKRAFDIGAALLGLALLLPLLLLIGVAVRLTSKGPALYWSIRAGRNHTPFAMPKFRSMRTDTPPIPAHLLDAEQWVTPFGRWLRATSLDELPQLWSVLRGDMSLVGPRPALIDEHDALEPRRQFGVDALKPGMTGLAQITDRRLSPSAKVQVDADYAARRSFGLDMVILLRTPIHCVREMLRHRSSHPDLNDGTIPVELAKPDTSGGSSSVIRIAA
jgi:O-antigen biosynthesis protein WbqP